MFKDNLTRLPDAMLCYVARCNCLFLSIALKNVHIYWIQMQNDKNVYHT